ncbi:glycosyl hydrolase catalytic core-domain-containing protein [Infundibulicybe gibba]|nr:glycosyl hydrolase catalytic core-domain-containing protein [Infundibulicybe gibba]
MVESLSIKLAKGLLPTYHRTASATTPVMHLLFLLTEAVLASPLQQTRPQSAHHGLPQHPGSPFTPNGIKAGIAGGDAYTIMQDHIGWWYDWTPNPSKHGKPLAVPMLWGGGTADKTDAARLALFKKIQGAPPGGRGRGDVGQLIAPFAEKGTKLGSPSMCKQADETWLAAFRPLISTPWDFTAIHINKNTLEGVKKDILRQPIWVTELACVNDVNGFTPCTDQAQIDKFIKDTVDYLQNSDQVAAFAYSNGLGLGDVWPLMKNGKLSPSGQTYLEAISKYH